MRKNNFCGIFRIKDGWDGFLGSMLVTAALWVGVQFLSTVVLSSIQFTAIGREEIRYSVMRNLLMAILVAPLIETSLVIFPSALAASVNTGYFAKTVLAAAPLMTIHFFMGVPKGILTLPLFLWSVHVAMQLRSRGIGVVYRYIHLSAIHSVWNIISEAVLWAISEGYLVSS